MSAFPLLGALVLTPAVAALFASRSRSDEGARRAAVVGAALTLLLSLAPLALSRAGVALAAGGPALPLLGARLRLGVDGYTIALLPLLGFVLLALVAAGPRAAVDRPAATALLATGSAILGVFCALDLAVLATAWIAALVPIERLIARKGGAPDPLLRRTCRIFLLGGTAPLALAIGAMAVLAARRGAALPFDIDEISRAGVPEAWQSPLFALVGIAVLMRMAAVPFHGWLPVLLERGPLGVTVLLAEMQVGVCVLLRVGAALLPAGCAEGMPILAVLGLVSALHGAVLALVQTDLRRMLGYLVASQKGLVLLGLASLSRESVSGALLQSVASSIALTGLAMVVGALEARAGTADTRALGGLVARTPRMAAFFFLLACAAIGMPGALSFVSEDLLLHGILHIHPVLSVLALTAAALNGITLFRAFQRVFLGPLRRDLQGASLEALLFRERAFLLATVALTVVLGVAPGRLLALHEPMVDQVLHGVARAAAARASAAASRRAVADAGQGSSSARAGVTAGLAGAQRAPGPGAAQSR
ncbi:NuoM family protein [Sorangium sp. Soce836]|uniref:complex I subunit 4 family protein n=1 Tax=Sorangium sp. So ce836 TaxID=2969250 RepID=UPI00234FBACC|nr:proton-conducting transporter membrane subunit [Sorangium sp. Soce836]WCQ93323.1 NADH-quinone oxidoreductase subunit M [Sorangium sp. Soce836]